MWLLPFDFDEQNYCWGHWPDCSQHDCLVVAVATAVVCRQSCCCCCCCLVVLGLLRKDEYDHRRREYDHRRRFVVRSFVDAIRTGFVALYSTSAGGVGLGDVYGDGGPPHPVVVRVPVIAQVRTGVRTQESLHCEVLVPALCYLPVWTASLVQAVLESVAHSGCTGLACCCCSAQVVEQRSGCCCCC